MKKDKSDNRGKDPSNFTVRMLWAKSAGMCEYPGCQERLFFDKISASRSNFAYVAHIVASSPDGPRGDINRSYELSDKFENLLLLCDKHHTLVDSDTQRYTESVLLQMKDDHERLIDNVCMHKTAPKTQIILLTAPIHGHDIEIQTSELYSALFPNRVLFQESPMCIRIDEIQDETIKDCSCWKLQDSKLKKDFNIKVMALFENHPDVCCDLFALAPIPLLARFGDLLGNKHSVFLHHKQRTTNTWKWQCEGRTAMFSINKHSVNNTNKEIVLVFSLSGTINISSLQEDINGIKDIFEVKASETGVDCLKSQADLDDFIKTYTKVLDAIHGEYPNCTCVHVIAAVPAVAAIEIGRQRMRNVHPKLIMYNAFNGHYINTGLIIGDNNA